MKILKGEEFEKALNYIKMSGDVAKSSSCERVKGGSVIVKDGEIIGRGFNSPPGNIENQKRCLNSKKDYDAKVTDKTCCIHAEERAMFDALRNNSEKIPGSRIYFTRLGSNGEIEFSKEPYCTICSKMALDLGIKEFVLYHEKGICSYGLEEYNELSFNYLPK
ncbi:MAG: hypothetical protein KC516_02885 [Nanoarchaeota archaeon]|nr:hypothetical protein [Nanoarchaeota archaeon]